MFVVDERRDEGAISWPWLLRVDRLSKRMVLLVFVFVVVVLRVVWQRGARRKHGWFWRNSFVFARSFHGEISEAQEIR